MEIFLLKSNKVFTTIFLAVLKGKKNAFCLLNVFEKLQKRGDGLFSTIYRYTNTVKGRI
jgi:hypothetical protein